MHIPHTDFIFVSYSFRVCDFRKKYFFFINISFSVAVRMEFVDIYTAEIDLLTPADVAYQQSFDARKSVVYNFVVKLKNFEYPIGHNGVEYTLEKWYEQAETNYAEWAKKFFQVLKPKGQFKMTFREALVTLESQLDVRHDFSLNSEGNHLRSLRYLAPNKEAVDDDNRDDEASTSYSKAGGKRAGELELCFL